MIADELRKYASSLAGKLGASVADVKDALEEIADHIDQEHDGEVFGLLREHDEWVHDRDANYIQLPKDADGETIHLGDKMDNTHKDGFRSKRVTGICYHEGGQPTIEVDEVRLRWHNAYKLHHVQPDSWAGIIDDAFHAGLRRGETFSMNEFIELVERCKRLAGEGA